MHLGQGKGQHMIVKRVQDTDGVTYMHRGTNQQRKHDRKTIKY